MAFTIIAEVSEGSFLEQFKLLPAALGSNAIASHTKLDKPGHLVPADRYRRPQPGPRRE